MLGKQLDLFSIQELAGPGLIFWHPKGGIIRKEMEDWMREEYLKRGYSLVYTPHVARRQLFFTSGHEGYYSQNMFDAMELDDAEYRLKPMNCPGHILIYKDSLKSYRDLPVRLGELGTVYRYERSGVMHGLLRVRGFTQDDAHIFCTPEQIEEEIASCLEFALDVLKDFGFDQFQTELSTWNPDDRKNFVGSEEQWNLATHSLENVLKELNIEYKTIPGEAAFYGPKIDIKLVDAIGRLWQLSTVQFDFNLPQRFGLEYVAEDGTRKQPLMVHRALYRIGRALLRRADRALRGGFPGVALAGAGGDDPHRRAPRGVREKSGGAAQGDRRARRSRCPQRKDERQDPRARHAESAVPAGGRRQRSRSRQSQRPHPRERKDRRHAGGGVRGEDQEADRGEELLLSLDVHVGTAALGCPHIGPLEFLVTIPELKSLFSCLNAGADNVLLFPPAVGQSSPKIVSAASLPRTKGCNHGYWKLWMGSGPAGPSRSHLFRASAVPDGASHVGRSTSKCPPVYDQGQLGSCTANSIGGAIEFEQMKQGMNAFVPSRLFIYYNERVLENTVNSDSGAQIRDGMKVVAKQGAPPETDWPYDIAKFAEKPPAIAFSDAAKNKVTSYQRVNRALSQFKGCLASGYPFVFGFTVYDSFESTMVAQTGHAPMPQSNEQVAGGHAVLAVGYDDQNQWFIVRNSWGDSWGNERLLHIALSISA